jgi:P27 family predicted phage terminase small subunit
MGKGGRPGVPARIKELSGTVRKDRMREGIHFDEITTVPKPEVWMTAKAKKYFKNICELLISKKLLTSANVPLVLIMASEFATYEEATREIRRGGMVQTIETKNGAYEQVTPWVAIRNQSMKNYKDVAALFGLDPLSQQKIGPAVRDTGDDFDKLTKKYN